MTGLINELMDAARLQTGRMELKPEDLDLDALVARVVETAQVLTEEQTITLQADAGPLPARGDAARLEQVLLNLLTNALAYAADSGRIEVRLGRQAEDAHIEVQDSGPGIPPEELPRIFTRYHRGSRSDQRREGGLGLGLFIAHQIVTAHGGRIEVASTVGEGTTFTVRLPLLDGEVSPAGE
jgi:signal transduction histidine kinase